MEFVGLLKGKVKVYKSGLHSITKLFEMQDFAVASCSEKKKSIFHTLPKSFSIHTQGIRDTTWFNILTSLLAMIFTSFGIQNSDDFYLSSILPFLMLVIISELFLNQEPESDIDIDMHDQKPSTY